MRTNQNTDRQVAQHRRQMQHAKRNHAKYRRDQQDEREFERRVHQTWARFMVINPPTNVRKLTSGRFFALCNGLYFAHECNASEKFVETF